MRGAEKTFWSHSTGAWCCKNWHTALLTAAVTVLSVVQVGAGALGCEFLKNFALMGTSCGGWPSLFDAASSAVLLLAGMLRSSRCVRFEWPFLAVYSHWSWCNECCPQPINPCLVPSMAVARQNCLASCLLTDKSCSRV